MREKKIEIKSLNEYHQTLKEGIGKRNKKKILYVLIYFNLV